MISTREPRESKGNIESAKKMNFYENIASSVFFSNMQMYPYVYILIPHPPLQFHVSLNVLYFYYRT